MFSDDPEPIGYSQSCVSCKAPYGVHDGLCASCDGRFAEGAQKPMAKSEAQLDAEWEAEERRQDDDWRREQERRDLVSYS